MTKQNKFLIFPKAQVVKFDPLNYRVAGSDPFQENANNYRLMYCSMPTYISIFVCGQRPKYLVIT